MSPYRKIDTRIWNDEIFVEADPLQKLAWFTLLTHPCMTPMGAGVFSVMLLDDIIGNARGYCWRCQEECRDHEHYAGTLLEWFQERSMILCQNLSGNGLIIIKNFLRYNCPDNPNQLAGWVHCVEELPRSSLWKTLRDHLATFENPLPEWLFDGLLNPLAENKLHDLKALYWARIQHAVKKPSGNPSWKPSLDGSKERIGNRPRKQEQEQEQEQDLKKEKIPSVSKRKLLTPRESRFLPAEFEITPDLRQWATTHVPDIDIEEETAQMRDHEYKTPRRAWPAAWRNWMRTASRMHSTRPLSQAQQDKKWAAMLQDMHEEDNTDDHN